MKYLRWFGPIALAIVMALAAPLAAQDSVRVDSAAADTLRLEYTPHAERIYCITEFHVEHAPNGVRVPVIDRVQFVAEGDSLSVRIPECFAIHTHPPGFPVPDGADIQIAVFMRRFPFCVIQFGPAQFASWNALPDDM